MYKKLRMSRHDGGAYFDGYSQAGPSRRQESAPLLVSESLSGRASVDNNNFSEGLRQFHSADESRFFDYIMEKVRGTKAGRLLERIAVERYVVCGLLRLLLLRSPGWERMGIWGYMLTRRLYSEPGLTNAQLMLNNHDLKPVEAERRQWGPWNFVGFWVADSFNIVGRPLNYLLGYSTRARYIQFTDANTKFR